MICHFYGQKVQHMLTDYFLGIHLSTPFYKISLYQRVEFLLLTALPVKPFGLSFLSAIYNSCIAIDNCFLSFGIMFIYFLF